MIHRETANGLSFCSAYGACMGKQSAAAGLPVQSTIERQAEICCYIASKGRIISGHEYDDVTFLDGGVWANNPVLVAVIDALSAYDITREQIEILSVGTGNLPFQITLKNAKGGLFRWREVIKAAMFLTTDNAHAQAALLIGPDKITRLEPSEQASGIELDDWDTSVKLLPSLVFSQNFQEHKKAILLFLFTKVLPRNRYYT